MRAIFIDATKQTMTEIDHSGKLADMYKTIGCELVECFNIVHNHDLWFDEEGAINDTERGFRLGANDFFGNALIPDNDPATGDCIATTAKLDAVQRLVSFWSVDERALADAMRA